MKTQKNKLTGATTRLERTCNRGLIPAREITTPARLIAAATELLAALEKICGREMTAWNGQVKGGLYEDICLAKTAIANATGQK